MYINCEYSQADGDWACRQISPELAVLPWIRGARSWSQITHMPLLWEGAGTTTTMRRDVVWTSFSFRVYKSITFVQCVLRLRAGCIYALLLTLCYTATEGPRCDGLLSRHKNLLLLSTVYCSALQCTSGRASACRSPLAPSRRQSPLRA